MSFVLILSNILTHLGIGLLVMDCIYEKAYLYRSAIFCSTTGALGLIIAAMLFTFR